MCLGTGLYNATATCLIPLTSIFHFYPHHLSNLHSSPPHISALSSASPSHLHIFPNPTPHSRCPQPTRFPAKAGPNAQSTLAPGTTLAHYSVLILWWLSLPSGAPSSSRRHHSRTRTLTLTRNQHRPSPNNNNITSNPPHCTTYTLAPRAVTLLLGRRLRRPIQCHLPLRPTLHPRTKRLFLLLEHTYTLPSI